MRAIFVVLVFVGCASQQKARQLEYAQQNTIACEYQRDLARSRGETTKADRIEVDCAWWRSQAQAGLHPAQREHEENEARRERTAAAWRNAYRPAALNCTSRQIGYSTHTSCD